MRDWRVWTGTLAFGLVLMGIAWAQSPSVGLTVTPGQVEPGGQVTLSWNAPWATECQATGAWTGVKAPVGTETVSPSRSGDYGLTCRGPMASGSAGVVVAEAAPPPPPPPPGPVLSCLEKPSNQIHQVTLNPDNLYTLTSPVAGHTYDYRGQRVQRLPTSHLMSIQKAGDMCLTGATAIGTQPRSATWLEVKRQYDHGGIQYGNMLSGADAVIQGVRIENVEDGLMMPRDPSHNGKNITWRLEDAWLEYIRDDGVENDSCLNGTIRNTLMDNIHMGLAARPSKGNDVPTLVDAKWDIDGLLLHLGCKPDTRGSGEIYRGPGSCPAGTSVAQVFKTSGCIGSITMKNSVIRLDAVGNGGPDQMRWLPGTYENVTLVWRGPGAYPGPALPRGVTLTTDINAWNNARAAWLARNGCSDTTKTCSWLQR